MKSLAIVRATDILKLKSTLLEMNKAGLSFESKPKEINPASVEKILSLVYGSSGNKYEVCALISLMQDYEFSQSTVKNLPAFSDVLVLDNSHKLFKDFVRLISVLPDLEIPRIYSKQENKQTEPKEKSPTVYLGVFVNKKVQVQTGSESTCTGILRHADSIGILLEPDDNSDPIFITWHDIKRIIIGGEKK